MHTLLRDGLPIHYEVHGDGPAALLLHGFSSTFRRNWTGTGWTRALVESGYRVVGPDFRGHGRSGKAYTPDAYLPETLCADLAGVLDDAEASPADVVGFSMGAAIALQFAILHPERVRRLIVSGIGDKALPSATPPPETAAISAALAADRLPADAAPIAQQFRRFAERGANDLKALAAMMGGPGWPGRVDLPGPVTCPTLVVFAESDSFMPTTERLRAFLPDARFVTIPGTDHIGLSQDPRFLTLGLEFLTGTMPS